MEKQNIKAFALLVMGFVCALGVFGSIKAASRQPLDTFSAGSETKRVWMKNNLVSTWDSDSARTQINYWGGAANTTFPGVPVKWDAANSLVYFDLPADITGYQFLRCSPTGTYWNAKTADLTYADSVGKYYNLTGPIEWDPIATPGSFVSFTPTTTTIVSNFVNSMNTDYSICSNAAIQTIVDNYNLMSSFEQDQFDALTITLPNGASVNAKTRLEELRTDFGIVTSLNALNPGNSQMTNSNLIATLTLIFISSSSLLGFFFLLKNKKTA